MPTGVRIFTITRTLGVYRRRGARALRFSNFEVERVRVIIANHCARNS